MLLLLCCHSAVTDFVVLTVAVVVGDDGIIDGVAVLVVGVVAAVAAVVVAFVAVAIAVIAAIAAFIASLAYVLLLLMLVSLLMLESFLLLLLLLLLLLSLTVMKRWWQWWRCCRPRLQGRVVKRCSSSAEVLHVFVPITVTLEYIEYSRWVVFAVIYNGLVVITIFYAFVAICW